MSARLFRGRHFGVFTGAHGYYVAAMAADGLSPQQPANQGRGWGDEVRDHCNSEAEDLEFERNAQEARE